MNKDFNKLCTPAKLYFVLSVFSCVAALFHGVRLRVVGVNLIVAFIWTAILGWFCNKGFSMLSWFLVLFPYIMMLFVFFGIMRNITSHKDIMMVVPPSATQQMM